MQRHHADLLTVWGDSVPLSDRLHGNRFVCTTLRKGHGPSVLRGTPLVLQILATCFQREPLPRKYKVIAGCFLNLKLPHLGMGLLITALSGFPAPVRTYSDVPPETSRRGVT